MFDCLVESCDVLVVYSPVSCCTLSARYRIPPPVGRTLCSLLLSTRSEHCTAPLERRSRTATVREVCLHRPSPPRSARDGSYYASSPTRGSTRPPPTGTRQHSGGKGKGKGRALDIAPQVDTDTTEALRYTARTKQRRTYLPYTFPAIAGTHLPIP